VGEPGRTLNESTTQSSEVHAVAQPCGGPRHRCPPHLEAGVSQVMADSAKVQQVLEGVLHQQPSHDAWGPGGLWCGVSSRRGRSSAKRLF
jgi:hypothetical protein